MFAKIIFTSCLLTMTGIFSSAVEAQETKPWTVKATYGVWEIRCASKAETKERPSCAAVLEFVRSETKALLLAWTITKSKDGSFVSRMVTPTGIVIQSGVRLNIEGDKQVYRIPYQTCWKGGCSASQTMSKDMLTSLKTAQQAAIVFTSTEGQDLRVDFKLNDIKGALAAL